jgi:hypothetical protein
MQYYGGIPGGCLVRPVDESRPWRFMIGLETIYDFDHGVDPTNTGLVGAFNRRVASLNCDEASNCIDADRVKEIGRKILHSLGVR